MPALATSTGTPCSSSISAAAFADRADERLVLEELALGEEPGAELALLPPRELRDALRVVRLALDERERLEDGVVHARGDLGSLLRADAARALGVALLRGAPEPRPDDEEEPGGERGRREQRAALADVAAARQQDDRAEREEHDPGDTLLPSPEEKHADGGESRGELHERRQPDPVEHGERREKEEREPDDRALAARPRPGSSGMRSAPAR